MRPWFYSLPASASLLMMSGCAHAPVSTETQVQMDAARDQILKLQERVQDLETRLGAMNDKINLENGVTPQAPAPVTSKAIEKNTPLTVEPAKKLPVEVATPPAAQSKSIPHVQILSKPAFASNEAVDRFREAKILFDSKRYSDAILEFSSFIKNEPDHALAASAQYYLGLCYLRQKEYKLAEEEFSRGMITYPHSSHIPDSLLAMAEVSELLNKSAKSAYFREKLQSQFPNSPQAKAVSRVRAFEEEPRVIENKALKSIPNENAQKPINQFETPKPAGVLDAPEAPEAPEAPKAHLTPNGGES